MSAAIFAMIDLNNYPLVSPWFILKITGFCHD